MTRKCVLCKETNYKNTCSFFSAPKDLEMRRKWQAAIGIDNYSVNDDTYVCSKHFYDSDIITHWISGAPPRVVSIKYKKCRLRPGAIPIKNIHLRSKRNKVPERNHLNLKKLNNFFTSHNSLVHSVDNTETLLIPKEDEISNINKECSKSKNHEYENINRSIKLQQSSEDESDINMSTNNYRTQLQLFSNKNNKYRNVMLKSHNNLGIKKPDNIIGKRKYKENIDYDKLFERKVKRSITHSWYASCYPEEETSKDMWDGTKFNFKNLVLKNCLDNTLKNKNICIKQNSLNIFKNCLDDCVFDEIREQEILFEDLLEKCFEVVLPRGWSCNVISKEHATTIVYLNMAITKDSMPYLEKQVFVKADMILRCSVLNREIDPIIYNLIKETYKDNIQRRHVLCPVIVNNDSTRCSKCMMLSHLIKYKSRESVPCKSNFNSREQRQMYICKKKRQIR
ncbi:hypothetical protein M0802_001035 [Mischocyttarus mexicanus]|nr:hypothetical protein M0802_001035 [Mischocyttarus mexicanus]